MLRELEIRDLAIIETLHLEFTPGMTALTGETGAGKSILVEALGLLLGDRADSGFVREGKEKAELSAIFDSDAGVAERLAALDIDAGLELLLRRSVRRDGRSRAWVNGSPVPVQVLRELGELLVDIHGQHAHQALLRRAVQCQLLDEFGGHTALRADLHRAYLAWRGAEDAVAQGAQGDQGGQSELLRYQLEELRAHKLGEQEYPQLLAAHRRMSNAQRILDTLHAASNALEGEEASLADGLEKVRQQLAGLLEVEPALQAGWDLLDSAGIQIKEAGDALRRVLEQVELDPARLAQLDARLGTWYELARKHKVREAELYAHEQALGARLAKLEQAAASQVELQQRRQAALAEWHTLAGQLHAARQGCAPRFAEEIVAWMRKLGMPEGRFQVELRQETDAHPAPWGADAPRFLVSANPGQPLRPLHKVASGGELSRISLATQIVGCKDRGTPVLVCDEVDAGIGGDTAAVVGGLLASLAEHRQVLCVSHLPQIAACAGRHCHVRKCHQGGQTSVAVRPLEGEARVEEIARMLGGRRHGAIGREHAREMLQGRGAP